jgi:hypothetical protein
MFLSEWAAVSLRMLFNAMIPAPAVLLLQLCEAVRDAKLALLKELKPDQPAAPACNGSLQRQLNNNNLQRQLNNILPPSILALHTKELCCADLLRHSLCSNLPVNS